MPFLFYILYEKCQEKVVFCFMLILELKNHLYFTIYKDRSIIPYVKAKNDFRGNFGRLRGIVDYLGWYLEGYHVAYNVYKIFLIHVEHFDLGEIFYVQD